MSYLEDPAYEAAQFIRAWLGEGHLPDIAIICGSGLSALDGAVVDARRLSYADIPAWPQSTVQGHVGELVAGTIGDKHVLLLRGRFHAYEGYSARTAALPVRVFALLGAKVLVVTNAAGGMNPEFNVGDIMVIQDHIYIPGIAGNHPLVGPNHAAFGTRFPSTAQVYDKSLQATLLAHADKAGLGEYMRHGVYVGVSGPSFETPHELQALRRLGGDTVGMSTCPEVVTAAHCGMKVLGVSLVTNKCLLPGDDTTPLPTHDEVLEATSQRTAGLVKLMSATVAALDLSGYAAPVAATAPIPVKPAAPAKPVCGLRCVELLSAAAVGALVASAVLFASKR